MAMEPLRAIHDVEQLEELLSRPTSQLVEAFTQLDGDVIVLGAGGKMGPTLARMAKRASEAAGVVRRVIAVSRFGDAKLVEQLESHGVETIAGDLLDPPFVDSLPNAKNVIFMAGMKFGATGQEPLTWAMNTHLPALAGRRFSGSRIAAFSTGNVYGLVDTAGDGSRESDVPAPVGEYAMSCLGRERMFQYFSEKHDTPLAIIRLNYACEMRYGVLVDIARRVLAGEAVDVSMGYANVIWQADANAMALCALADATPGGCVVNVTGPEKLRIRDVAEEFARRFGQPAAIAGEESSQALLSNAHLAHEKYGSPSVSAERLIEWTADWLARGGATLDKPTRFEVADGKF